MTIEIVDPTRLRDTLQCLRLFYWRHERHYVPVGPRLPLVYGSSGHECLAENYRGKPAGVCLEAFEKVWDREVSPSQDEMSEEDPKRNPIRWAEVFMLYRRKYLVEPFKVLAVEAPFFLPVTDNLAFAGIVDLLIEYLGRPMVMDHKTASYLNQAYFDTFNPNHQVDTYLTGASGILGQHVDTLMFNCILVHPTENDPDRLFIRHSTTRSAAQLAQAKKELIGWWNIIKECRRTGNWPRNDDRCQRWRFGNRGGACEYHPLCTDATGTDFRKMIPSKVLYKESVWDPIIALRSHGLEVTV